MNTFFHGDCLFVMNHDIEPNSIDLIYLDPPFFTGKVQKGETKKATEWMPEAMPLTYQDGKQFWKEKGLASYAPEWLKHLASDLNRPDFAAYLYYMMERLELCKKVLKSTGSIYLHCDYRASHYLKMIMDEVFGEKNFRNDIAWCYTGPSNVKRWFPRKHDSILFYSKDESQNRFYPDSVRVPYKDGLSLGRTGNRGIFVKRYNSSEEEDLAEQLTKGKIVEDYWIDIHALKSYTELTGYPTQKPLALLERIILASSNEGDLVLDPFCGCGTTIIAAQKHSRQWIGIDINKQAYDVSKGREHQLLMEAQTEYREAQYISRDLKEVKAMKGQEFEKWVNQYHKATKPSPDRGVDGITKDGTPIQTKTWQITYDVIDSLIASSKLHPLVKKPVEKAIAVSQTGFDNNTRERQYTYKEQGIQVDLLTPDIMLKMED